MHPFKTYWRETNILTQQIKLSNKKGHCSAKIWQMITNVKFDLYFTIYKLHQTLNKINTSLQKLLSWNKKCDAAAAGHHDPYVCYAMQAT